MLGCIGALLKVFCRFFVVVFLLAVIFFLTKGRVFLFGVDFVVLIPFAAFAFAASSFALMEAKVFPPVFLLGIDFFVVVSFLAFIIAASSFALIETRVFLSVFLWI